MCGKFGVLKGTSIGKIGPAFFLGVSIVSVILDKLVFEYSVRVRNTIL